ncbi:MAG TPA: serine/threonine-protein kinase [Phycisphaerales bacterium]|nr:serine/threonine-protein kinase [Phycisphaerales bacterium]
MGGPSDSSVPDLTPTSASRLLHALRDPPDRDAHPGLRDEASADAAAGVAAGGGLAAPPGYSIVERVGRGGGGTVYRALRAGSEIHLALKILSMPLGSGPDAQRAWRELGLLESLRLPVVPRLLDYGTHDGRLFFATEFVDGRRPDEHADAERLDRRARVALLARICDAAATLHEHGVIHRDLKPGNILITPGGSVAILDLGLASLLTEDAAQTLTSEGQPVGTPAFMAPEQARGERARLSTRTDVYALGAIGYLLFTGHTPHDLGDSLHEAIRRVAQDRPRAPRDLDPNLPKALAAVLEKACAPEPDRRYSGAGELAADLRRWLAGQPVDATPAGPWVRVVRRVQRHPIAATAAACVLLAGGIWGATWGSLWWLNQRPYDIYIDEARRTVSIVTRLGKPLHTWESGIDGGIRYAKLVDAGQAFSPRLRIFTVIEKPVGLHEDLESQLCVWDARRPSTLLWRTHHDGPRAPRTKLPPTTSNDFLTTSERYGVTNIGVVIADVFPGDAHPGDEIIVPATHHRADPSTIRVYSMDGDVLFESWHWGSAGNVVWLQAARQIVAYGCDNVRPWDEIGLKGTTIRWPRVVFALRPTAGARHGWVNPELAEPGDEPLWYRYLLPPEIAEPNNGLDWEVRLEPADRHALGAVLLTVSPKPLHEYKLELDDRGKVVYSWSTDNWRTWAAQANPPTPYLADSPLEALRDD